MGGHMAKTLIKKGYPVIASDVSPAALQVVRTVFK
jgi:3-hydroxyisobutyrate dehydrogenase-like beta-hydroxyacid dehydrogenase